MATLLDARPLLFFVVALFLCVTIGRCEREKPPYKFSNNLYDFENCGLPTSAPKAKRELRERRSEQQVMGGKDAQPGEHPWAAKLSIQHGDPKKEKPAVCSGVLVSRRHVLTAGHCFGKPGRDCESLSESEALAALSVQVGGVCTSVDESLGCTSKLLGRDYRAKSVAFGRFFNNDCGSGEDIAVIELSEDVDSHVHHICLPHLHESDALIYKRMTALGFGSDPKSHPSYHSHVPRLQKLDVGKLLRSDHCQVEDVPKDVLCSVEKRRANVCKGDSGGALLAKERKRFMLVGLVSAGASCKDLLHNVAPGLQTYTSTSYYTATLDAALGIQAPKVY